MEQKIFEKYLIYLHFIQNKLDKYFEAQSPFIFCKNGCSLCCKNQQLPYTKIEAEYLLLGLSRLHPDTFKIVEENINNLIENMKKADIKEFRYDCPFLINDSCTIYEYRGLVCRAFGLMIRSEDGENSGVPFCCFKGLNFSNVINLKTRQVSKAKHKKLKTEKTPNLYNISYEFLTNDDFAKGFGFEFGEKRTMCEWLELFKKEADML